MLPDLTVLGKVIGGGLPAAAYAGRRDLMERIAPAGDVYQAGTLSGQPAGHSRRPGHPRLLDEPAYARLAGPHPGARGRAGGARRPGGVPVQVARTTGLFTLFFAARRYATTPGPAPATSTPTRASAARCSSAGVYLPPSQFEAWFPSLAHSDGHVERTLDAAEEAFRECVT